MFKEFIGFLKQYGVIGLAIAVIIGGKANDLVKSLVDNILMPLVSLALPANVAWKDWQIELAEGKSLMIGPVLSTLVDFLIVAFFVFLFAKLVLREEQVVKK